MTDDDTNTTPAFAAAAAAHDAEQKLLEEQERRLANEQLELAARKATLAAKAREPRSPDALGLKARDAIMCLLAHRTAETAATEPERQAWSALAQFLEACCGN